MLHQLVSLSQLTKGNARNRVPDPPERVLLGHVEDHPRGQVGVVEGGSARSGVETGADGAQIGRQRQDSLAHASDWKRFRKKTGYFMSESWSIIDIDPGPLPRGEFRPTRWLLVLWWLCWL